jgi:hypothetical protein
MSVPLFLNLGVFSIFQTDSREIFEFRLDTPASDVLRDRHHDLVLALGERQVERIEVADAAQEPVVPGARGIVAAKQ